MALTLLADAWAEQHGGRITALTVDHGLRPNSTQEAQQVAGWMRARGIAHVILTPPMESDSNNMLEAARQRRYDALADWCKQNQVLHCLLAHQADDQRETVAIHTARGDTADGNSGMAAVRNYRGVRFLRPLLNHSKQELLAHLRAQDVAWVEDPTNSDLRFARARLRAQGAADLDPAAAQARHQREWALADAAMRCVALDLSGAAKLDLAIWRAMPVSVGTQLLADLVRTIGGKTTRPRRHETLRLADMLRGGKDCKCTLGGCLIVKRDNDTHISREKRLASEPFHPPKPLAAAPFWWLNRA